MKKRKKSATGRKKYKGNPMASLTGTLVRQVIPRLFTRSFLLVLIVVLGLLMVEWVSGQAGDNRRFTVYPDSLKCLSRPQWLASSDRITTEIMGAIQEELSLFPPEDIFSETLEEAFKTRLHDFSPWIESVKTFQRIYPSRYRVELNLRKPVAIFLDRNRSYFIDASGVVIASVDQLDRGRVKAALPIITGFGDLDPVVEGSHTRNRRLIEGAAVAKEIEVFATLEALKPIRVVEIEVSAFGSNRPAGVTLFTSDNVRVLWGRSARNASFRGIDPTPLEKARSLERVVDGNPGLRGIDTVTVTFRNAKPSITRRADEL